jgi:hypothetical protein
MKTQPSMASCGVLSSGVLSPEVTRSSFYLSIENFIHSYAAKRAELGFLKAETGSF